MTSIFVAKLDFGVSSEQLKELFEQHGKVLKANVATDRETGKSRGFGFVEMSDDDAARTAISALHDNDVQDRKIVVNESTPRPEGERREGGFKKSFGGGGGNRGGGGYGGGGNRSGGSGGGYNRDRGGNGGGGGGYNRY